MNKGRLEAFSDGVLAIIITIMVLDLKVPHGTSLADLRPLIPIFLTYVLSFIYVGIYWINHHHLWQTVGKVNGKILWANLLLLFCLSLFPFATGWMGENHFQRMPVIVYGIVLLAADLAWRLLIKLVIQGEKDEQIVELLKGDKKPYISTLCYLAAVGIGIWQPVVSCIVYGFVALYWFIPSRDLEEFIRK